MSITIVTSVTLDASPEQVFAFHADVTNLPRLTPGPARVLSGAVPSREGDLQVIRLGVPPLTLRWHARIARMDPPHTTVDVQERGPFRVWRHTHSIVPTARGAVLVDVVEFRLVPGRFGRVIDALLVAAAMRLFFAVRHRRTRRLLDARRRR